MLPYVASSTNHQDGGDDGSSNDNRYAENNSYEYATGIEDPSELPEGRYRLLVPVLSESSIEDVKQTIQTAAMIAEDRDGDLLVLCIVRVPEQTPYGAVSEDQQSVQDAHETAERLFRSAEETGVSAQSITCLTHREAPAILDIADRYDCEGVFMTVESERSQRRRLLSGDAVEKIVSRAVTDVFVKKPGERENPAERILLTVSGGPHSGLATETARALALKSGAKIDVVHFIGEDATDDQRDEATDIFRAAKRVLDDIDRVDTELIKADDIAAEIITRSDAYDVTVLGAPTMGLLKQFVFGTVPDSVTQRTDNTVLMTKQQTDVTSAYYRWIAGEPST